MPLSSPIIVDASARIRGTGEMAQRIRDFDWSATSLGPIKDWSETLTSTVNLLLSFPFSFAIYLGEQQIPSPSNPGL